MEVQPFHHLQLIRPERRVVPLEEARLSPSNLGGDYEAYNSHPQWSGQAAVHVAPGDLSANKVGAQARFLGQPGFAKSESPMVPI
jgi:hypothetical protein